MVTAKDCLKKYGEPSESSKWLTLWDVPTELEIGVIPKRIYCNKDLVEPLKQAFKNLIATGCVKELKTWDGCFNIRKVRGKSSPSLHCIPKGESVWTLDGRKNIEDVKVGDTVLSYNQTKKDLEEKKVTKTFINGEKRIIDVNIRNYKIRCSVDHEIMTLKKTTLEKQNWINKDGKGHIKAIYETELVRAADLKKGDKVVILKDAKKLQKSDENNLIWFEILGMYIGDGCFHNRNGSEYNYVSFQFPKEDRVRDHVRALLNSYFNNVKENDKQFTIYSKSDYEIFRKYNYKAWEKFIPEEVFNASIEQKIAFIKGLIYSDGYTCKSYNKNNKDNFTLKYALKTASKRLIEDLKLLCSLIGIKTSNISYIKPQKKIIKDVECQTKGAFSMCMTDYSKLIELKDDNIYSDRQLNSNNFNTYNSRCFGYEHVGDNFTIETVTSIEYSGNEETYDIEVEDNHLFILNGVVVSNSWAIAVDCNAANNPLGLTREQIVAKGLKPFSEKFLQCFRDAGFDCGADFKSRSDFMHMQLSKI